MLTDFIGSDDIAFALAIQPDLKIVAAGETWQNGKWNFSLARYFSGLNVGVIDEPAEHFELSAYPNPASSYINLNYELANNATVSIAVYDVMGKRIKSYVHNETKIKGMQAEALAVDDLKKGVYILRIETERVQRGVRFVKN
ncbi:MAG: T9SS type A sorting domain-containing protein [Bacteroidetes bacterium]|nr:T9SS type A sorting domain-containing protein [Bacteroidota bacterium]